MLKLTHSILKKTSEIKALILENILSFQINTRINIKDSGEISCEPQSVWIAAAVHFSRQGGQENKLLSKPE